MHQQIENLAFLVDRSPEPESPSGNQNRHFIEMPLRSWPTTSADDVAPADGVRIVQFTPPGSGCSVTFGKGITAAAPGSAAGALVVSDIVAAHADLVGRGIEASEMWHGAPFPPEARVKGPDPKRASYGSFFAFNDPDGNAWIVQEVTTRRPGRT